MKNIYKRILTISILALVSSQVQSQVIIALLFGDKLNTGKLEFGLTGGLNLSDISALEQAKLKAGLNLGLFFNIKLSDDWYVHPEAVPKYPTGVTSLKPYSLGDANLDSLLQDGDVTRKIKTIALPILMRYRLKGELYAEAGPQIGLRTKAKDVFQAGDLSYENKIEDQLTRFDFGFAFGMAQRLRKDKGGVALSIRYYLGLTDIDKLSNGSQKNGIFQILASIPVGAGKHNEEKKQ